MITRALDATGDWLFGKGRNDYKSGNDAVAQNIVTRLLMVLNDCFFAKNDGIDWFNLLGAKNQYALELSVSTVILNTAGVTKLNKLSVNLSSLRAITISYSADTVYTGLMQNSSEVAAATLTYLLDESGNFLVTEDGNRIEV